VDVGLLPHLALRPQLDYVGLRNSGQTPIARASRSASASMFDGAAASENAMKKKNGQTSTA